MKKKPNFLVILIDDLRFDEFGAGGHPYMKTPNVDRIAREGANFLRAFHPTPICSPKTVIVSTTSGSAPDIMAPNRPEVAMSEPVLSASTCR